MRRYWSGHVEAFFNIRHAYIDIEVSGKNKKHFNSKPKKEASSCVLVEVISVWLFSNAKVYSSQNLLQVPHWIGVTCDLLISFHYFLDLKKTKYWYKSCVWIICDIRMISDIKFYLYIDEIVEWVDVLFHQSFHLKYRIHGSKTTQKQKSEMQSDVLSLLWVLLHEPFTQWLRLESMQHTVTFIFFFFSSKFSVIYSVISQVWQQCQTEFWKH